SNANNKMLPIEQKNISKSEAEELFGKKDQPYKLELIQQLGDEHDTLEQCCFTVSLFSQGDFIDLCKGPHVASTGKVKAFKLTSLAGAYWRGSERNPMLQRIYGTAFADRKQLSIHLKNLEEAKKRDHRRIGKQLELFSFHEEAPGFPFYLPKGLIVYEGLMNYCRDIMRREDYEEIRTPVILNQSLWEKSGHWDHYKDNMYFTRIDDDDFAVKPMNCPGGLLVYKEKIHSYRELPLRVGEMGLVHRHELSGVLHGLFRVRNFIQDDAHIFCQEDQIEAEVVNVIKVILEVYQTLGFKECSLELSTRPDDSMGSDQIWEIATNALKGALKTSGNEYELNEGEGVFYGPKIDFHIKDCLGRSWQCGTIQVDFLMPERFNLEYTGSDGKPHRPVMIHRAVLGSFERFLGIMIEHYAGAFPVWLAPVQAIILPIADEHIEYTGQVKDKLLELGLRVTVDQRNEKIGKKIRDAQTQKIPHMLVIGSKEAEQESVAWRTRSEGDQGMIKIEEFIAKITDQIEQKK
ncbi:MAG: threonine--tRNA ligase, partial [Candidatus Omnitrophica bacterium]|nr:threonine--tRNA ligase [Candidatus Omnitrophota bacterium]